MVRPSRAPAWEAAVTTEEVVMTEAEDGGVDAAAAPSPPASTTTADATQATEEPDEPPEPELEAEPAAAGEEEEEEEVEEEADARPPNALSFNEPLSWKAGKAISIATLIKRLTRLSKELSELDQEGVDLESLATPSKELHAVGLLKHKDPGVRAFTACCLADMLRLHAPDAPYTASILKVCMCVFCPVCIYIIYPLISFFFLVKRKNYQLGELQQ